MSEGTADDESEPHSAETGTVTTNGIGTYYERRGDGPVVVFIHSMAMNATQWEPQVAALAGEYTTVTYDVRGHGRTGGSERSRYSMSLYASDLAALLSALDVERPILCGLSMGGCIAQVYAATYPDRVAGLVLSDTFTAAPLPLSGRLVFTNLRILGLLDRIVGYTTLNRVQTWLGERLSPGIAGDRTTTQRIMEATPRIPHAEFRKIARSMASFPESTLDADRIVAPTLIMHGEHVPAVFRDGHLKLAAQLTAADVEMAVVPDAGHASNVDNPEAFTARVEGFLSRVHGDSGH